MGFQPIQGDYFEKPTGLTAEDLLKWDGAALARIAVGTNGQFLGVNGSGALAFANGSPETQTVIYGSPFEVKRLQHTFTSPLTRTMPSSGVSGTSGRGFVQVGTLAFNAAVDSFFESGYSYMMGADHNGTDYSTPHRVYGNMSVGSDSSVWAIAYGLADNANIPQEPTGFIGIGYAKTGLTFIGASNTWGNIYTYGGMTTGQRLLIPYNGDLQVGVVTYDSSGTYNIANNVYTASEIDLYIGKTLPSSFTLSSISGKFSTLKNIILNPSDSVILNGDSTNYTFTNYETLPFTICGLFSTKNYRLDVSEITEIQIAAGNPRFEFTKA